MIQDIVHGSEFNFWTLNLEPGSVLGTGVAPVKVMVSEDKKRACVLSQSVMSNSVRPYGLQLARLLCPWGFSRQEYWSGLPFPPPGNLPDPGIEPTSLMPPALAGGFFTTSATWENKKH